MDEIVFSYTTRIVSIALINDKPVVSVSCYIYYEEYINTSCRKHNVIYCKVVETAGYNHKLLRVQHVEGRRIHGILH